MKPYIASLINAIVLIALGAWGYFGSDHPSATALIPVGMGVILLVLNFWMRNGNRIVAHIVVVLTLLILIALIKPLSGAIGRSDPTAIIRVSIMMLVSVFAMAVFVKSFIGARRKE